MQFFVSCTSPVQFITEITPRAVSARLFGFEEEKKCLLNLCLLSRVFRLDSTSLAREERQIRPQGSEVSPRRS